MEKEQFIQFLSGEAGSNLLNDTEVSSLLSKKGLKKVDKTVVEEFLGTAEGKPLVDSFYDKGWNHHFNLKKGKDVFTKEDYEAYKTSLTPKEETPEQKELREIKEEMAATKKESAIYKNKQLATEMLAKDNIPVELVEFIVSHDETLNKTNAEKLATIFKNYAEKVKTDILNQVKGGSYKPGGDPSGTGGASLATLQADLAKAKEKGDSRAFLQISAKIRQLKGE